MGKLKAVTSFGDDITKRVSDIDVFGSKPRMPTDEVSGNYGIFDEAAGASRADEASRADRLKASGTASLGSVAALPTSTKVAAVVVVLIVIIAYRRGMI